jgi:hypothetical protein
MFETGASENFVKIPLKLNRKVMSPVFGLKSIYGGVPQIIEQSFFCSILLVLETPPEEEIISNPPLFVPPSNGPGDHSFEREIIVELFPITFSWSTQFGHHDLTTDA